GQAGSGLALLFDDVIASRSEHSPSLEFVSSLWVVTLMIAADAAAGRRQATATALASPASKDLPRYIRCATLLCVDASVKSGLGRNSGSLRQAWRRGERGSSSSPAAPPGSAAPPPNDWRKAATPCTPRRAASSRSPTSRNRAAGRSRST